uniref:Uncharacterized protein n=1 Tax=Nothobranchius korthausae TaxID=1143690 RepID=A0A1A8FE55_9TELE
MDSCEVTDAWCVARELRPHAGVRSQGSKELVEDKPTKKKRFRRRGNRDGTTRCLDLQPEYDYQPNGRANSRALRSPTVDVNSDRSSHTDSFANDVKNCLTVKRADQVGTQTRPPVPDTVTSSTLLPSSQTKSADVSISEPVPVVKPKEHAKLFLTHLHPGTAWVTVKLGQSLSCDTLLGFFSGFTMVTPATFDRICSSCGVGVEPPTLTPCSVMACAFGREFIVSSRFDLEITIGPLTLSHPCYVSDHARRDLVLGADFMRRIKASVDLGASKLWSGGVLPRAALPPDSCDVLSPAMAGSELVVTPEVPRSSELDPLQIHLQTDSDSVDVVPTRDNDCPAMDSSGPGDVSHTCPDPDPVPVPLADCELATQGLVSPALISDLVALSPMPAAEERCSVDEQPVSSDTDLQLEFTSGTNQLASQDEMEPSDILKHEWPPDEAILPSDGFVTENLDLSVTEDLSSQLMTFVDTQETSKHLSQECDSAFGLCALFSVISPSGVHDGDEMPAVASSDGFSGDIEEASVVTAASTLTGAGFPPDPGGVDACSGAPLWAPPDKGGVLGGTESSVADSHRSEGSPPSDRAVMADNITDPGSLRPMTWTSDPQVGDTPSKGGDSSRSASSLVNPGISERMCKPTSFFDQKSYRLHVSVQNMLILLATCLCLILNISDLAVAPVMQRCLCNSFLGRSFVAKQLPKPPDLGIPGHVSFRIQPGEYVNLLGKDALWSLRNVPCSASSVSQTRNELDKFEKGGVRAPDLRASSPHFQFTPRSDRNKVVSDTLINILKQVKPDPELTTKPSASIQFQTWSTGISKLVSLWSRNTRFRPFNDLIAFVDTNTNMAATLVPRDQEGGEPPPAKPAVSVTSCSSGESVCGRTSVRQQLSYGLNGFNVWFAVILIIDRFRYLTPKSGFFHELIARYRFNHFFVG